MTPATSHQFKLQNGSKKYTCPACGHENKFTAYVHLNNNEPVDTFKYGRCDRENSCAYHLAPSADASPEDYVPTPKPEVEILQIYPDASLLDPIRKRTRTCVSAFHRYCKNLGISMDHLLKWGVYTDGGHEELTAFLYIRSGDNKVTNVKWFKYQENGGRDKDFNSFSLKQPNPSSSTPPKKSTEKSVVSKYKLGLFGANLLSPTREKLVCVVESEKTAVIASWFYKDFDFVSCGSSNGLTLEKIQESLLNRTVYWICDNDRAGREKFFNEKTGKTQYNSSIRNGKKMLEDNFFVVDLFNDEYQPGYDLADAIRDGLRPDLIAAPKRKEKGREETYSLPKGCDIQSVKNDIEKYGVFTYGNRIYVMEKSMAIPKSNFEIKALGHVISSSNPRRLVAIQNIHKQKKSLQIATKAFISNTEWSVSIESEGNFQWNGSVADLRKLRSYLYDKMRSFVEIRYLGWQDSGHFVWANGAFRDKLIPADSYGFCDIGEPENYFIEALSSISSSNYDNQLFEDEKKFIYKERTDVNTMDWAKIFCKVHKQNGRIALCWFTASLFRDLIYRRFKFFPHLFLFGPPGSGKSQVGWSIRSLGFCGIKKPFNLSGGTQVAFHREFSHFINFPAWFDEYDNAIDYQRVQSLKSAYDGSGHKKSVKDNDTRTNTTPVNSSCMISGQHLPTADNALFKRVILLQFHQTEFLESEKEDFRKLQKIEEKGLTFITGEILKSRKVVESKFDEAYDKVFREFADFFYEKNVEDRIIINTCIILAATKVLMDIVNFYPFTWEEITNLCKENIKEQMSLISNANEANTFWDIFLHLADKNEIIENFDYKFYSSKDVTIQYGGTSHIRSFDQVKDLIAIRPINVFEQYKLKLRQQGEKGLDKGSLINYLQHQKYFIGSVKNMRFNASGRYDESKTRVTSCFVFDVILMRQQGIDIYGDSNIDQPF